MHFLQFQLKIVFDFSMKESCWRINRVNVISPWSGFRWYISCYIHEVLSQQSQRFRFYLQFRLSGILNACAAAVAVEDFFQPFLENTFGAVKTIMRSISQKRLSTHSLRVCSHSYEYCGQFSFSILFFIVTFRTGTTRNICELLS